MEKFRKLSLGKRFGIILLTVVGFYFTLGTMAAFAASMLLVGITITEPTYLSDVLLGEADHQLSRRKVTVLSGQNLSVLGTILGMITLGDVTETHAGNTGDGAMTLDATTPKLANCQAGVYRAVCITATADGGTFEVFDPKGNSLGTVVVAATFTNQIKFVIADGAADFIVGDTFLITVAEGSKKVTALNLAALDGSQIAYGILVAGVDASSGDLPGVAIERLAVLKSADLVWPDGITDAQKAAAIAQLEAKDIIMRQVV